MAADTVSQLHSVHAPIFDAMKKAKWVGSFSNASGDDATEGRAGGNAGGAPSRRRSRSALSCCTWACRRRQQVATRDNQPDAAGEASKTSWRCANVNVGGAGSDCRTRSRAHRRSCG
jgi:hypothetical protein